MGAVEDAGTDPEGADKDAAEASILPSTQSLEIADNILNRLAPKDRHDLGKMIHKRALYCGSIAASLALFWWLSIQRLGDDPINQSESLVKGITFTTLSYLVPVVVFFASILNAASRERGQPGPALIAGAMFLVMGFFSLEPLVLGLLNTDVEATHAIWQTARLVILGVGFFFVAKLFIEAFLLNWVMRLEEAFSGMEIMPLANKPKIVETEPQTEVPDAELAFDN
jgi:Na+-transporting methylmalonyl-CoA/oxaloacetate decarboxylase gamma subunit